MKKAERALASMYTQPTSIAIVCLGTSMENFVREAMTTQRLAMPYTEIWTLNRGITSIMHDKMFAMDDLRWLEHKDKHYGKVLRKHDKPIVTSTVYPEFPTSVAYPYNEVCEFIGDDIFNVNTVSYMLAFALFLRVKAGNAGNRHCCDTVHIFGADFFYPNGNHAESGGQAVAYLCGRAKQYDMHIMLPNNTTLMYAHKCMMINGKMSRPPYGYHRKAELEDFLKKQAEKKKAK